MEFTDAPDTLEYEPTVIIPGTLISLNFRIGFRINPQVSVYLRQAIEDLVAKGEVDIASSYPSLRRHGISGDFSFIIIHRIFSPSSQCDPGERRLMNFHSILRHMEMSSQSAFGLDTSDVTVENVPLIINKRPTRRITPITN